MAHAQVVDINRDLVRRFPFQEMTNPDGTWNGLDGTRPFWDDRVVMEAWPQSLPRVHDLTPHLWIACIVAQSVVEDYRLEVVDAFPLSACLFDSAAVRSNEDVSTQGGPTAVFLHHLAAAVFRPRVRDVGPALCSSESSPALHLAGRRGKGPSAMVMLLLRVTRSQCQA